MTAQNDLIKTAKLAEQFTVAARAKAYDSIGDMIAMYDCLKENAEMQDLLEKITAHYLVMQVGGDDRTAEQANADVAPALIRFAEIYTAALRALFPEKDLARFLPAEIRTAECTKVLKDHNAPVLAALCHP